MLSTLTCVNKTPRQTAKYAAKASNVCPDDAVKEPMSHTIMLKARFGSMTDVTNMMRAEKIALRITPAKRTLCTGSRSEVADMRYSTPNASSPPRNPQMGNTGIAQAIVPTPERTANDTPSAEPLETPSM